MKLLGRIFMGFLVAFLWASLGGSQSLVPNSRLADALPQQPVPNHQSPDDTLDSELVRAGQNTILLSMLFLMLSFLAFGITIAIAGSFALFAFTAWGIIATSVIVNLYQRSLSKQFRMHLLLIDSLVGMFVSIVGWWIIVRTFQLSHADARSFLLAAGLGLLSGILLGFMTGPLASWLLDSFKRQLFNAKN